MSAARLHALGPIRRAAFAVLVIAAGCSGAPAWADGLRAAPRDGYGRIVFDWDQPIRYAAEVVGGQLVVQFERPITGNINDVAAALSAYVQPGRLSADGRTATFPLRANVTMRTFTVGNAVVVDLTGPTAPVAVAPQAPSPTTPSAAPALLRPAAPPQPAVPTAAPPAAPPAGPVGAVPVRTGVHPEYFRLVFDWPVSTPFTIERRGDRVAIAFNAAGAIDVDALRRRLPAANNDASVTTENGRTIVSFPLSPDINVRNFTNGNSVVVDLMTTATAAAPQPARQAAAATTPASPQPTTAPAPRQAAPATPPAPQPPRQPSAAARALTGTVADEAQVDAAGRRVTGAQAGAPAGANRAVDPLAGRPAEVSLTIPFDEPAAAAVFRRADYLWVVFDRYKQVDVAELAKKGAPYITLIEQLPYRTNTILRMVTQPDINPSMRRDNLDWTLDFRALPLRPTRAVEVVPQLERPQPNLYIPLTEAGRTVAFEDPEVGDYLLVVPVIPLGYGVFPERTFPDVTLPITAQGVVIVPQSDGVRALATRSGIDIDVDGGMALSKIAAEQLNAQAKEEDLNRILNLSDWQIGREEDYLRNKQAMQNAIADAAAAAKQEARLRFARFEFINGFYPEVLGILRVVQSTEPEIENTAPFRALRGATNLMMRRWEEAADDFAHFSLANDDDARFWLAAAREKMEGTVGAHAQTLIQTGAVIRAYPRRVKVPLALIGAEAAIAAGDDFGAQGFLDLLRRERPEVNELAAIDYLDGRLNERIGELRVAL
ncbi:MAG: hypothetical protein SFV21_12385, partial [Rhodospirillaceae bacterium]|nr:hypothetical protein [Rhodospirillaceae bacterium]